MRLWDAAWISGRPFWEDAADVILASVTQSCLLHLEAGESLNLLILGRLSHVVSIKFKRDILFVIGKFEDLLKGF